MSTCAGSDGGLGTTGLVWPLAGLPLEPAAGSRPMTPRCLQLRQRTMARKCHSQSGTSLVQRTGNRSGSLVDRAFAPGHQPLDVVEVEEPDERGTTDRVDEVGWRESL